MNESLRLPRIGMLLQIGLLATSVMLLWSLTPALAIDPIEGNARALRADMLVVGGARIKLKGILPPGDAERCGDLTCYDAAKRQLAELVAGKQVVCTRERRLQHGLYLGLCRLETDQDPGADLLRAGLATPSGDLVNGYAEARDQAAAAGRGIFEK